MLAAYQRSGLPQGEFAAQAGIARATLIRWLRNAAAQTSVQSAFVPVPNLFSAAPATPAYRLEFPQGMIVEVAPAAR